MALLKCKMCGGDLHLEEGVSVAECEYCGTQQTVPAVDDEKKLVLFERANRLRMGCEFDKAAGVYESIVAEFRTEAEAYWGLVLCKYGIEYVDDPATGKKVPTCHRSSFDSILDDADLEQALENADPMARRLYREEAKTMEELRRGIIEVSGKEEPYDIFICYKETDEKGERTIDSVIAQDVYDALTDKGYRVFFSRISLEDKLGREYEPYIFAALNSAKIMLAFGTDYEYYNAVWVKNEWSRFLKLMGADKEKHLIPCYKGIDAYDMPKEFAKLQAQDMGKVGAIQDLLRGIEKLMPGNTQTAQQVVNESVVVQQMGMPMGDALVDRGFIAIEDGEWKHADEFFEQALNQNAKNGRTYFGKFLVSQRCASLDGVIRTREERAESTWRNARDTVSVDCADAEREEKLVQRYVAQPRLCADDKRIRAAMKYQNTFNSGTSAAYACVRQAETWLAEDRNLARAIQYGTSEECAQLEQFKRTLMERLSEQLEKAKQHHQAKVAEIKEGYEAHLQQAEEELRRLYEETMAQVDREYTTAIHAVEQAKTIKEYAAAQKLLKVVGDYREIAAFDEQCQQSIQRLKDEAAARSAAAAARRKKIFLRVVKWVVSCLAATVVLVGLIVLLVTVILPHQKNGGDYQKATELMQAGDYIQATELFEQLGGFKDSEQQALECRYSLATELMNAGDLDAAAAAFQEIASYRDSAEMVAACLEQQDQLVYGKAEKAMESGQLLAAFNLYREIPEYKDSAERVLALRREIANQGATIDVGGTHTVGIQADGTLRATKYNNVYNDYSGQCDVSGWEDVVMVRAGYAHTIGLKEDGTVVATKHTGNENYGQCKVSGWTNIVAIAAGSYHSVGVKANGTVVAVGDNTYGQCNVSKWTDIIAVSASDTHTFGLKADGTVVGTTYTGDYANNYDYEKHVKDWTDIVAISDDGDFVLGLKADGTVVKATNYSLEASGAEAWKNMVAIASGHCYSIGLKDDGTVLMTVAPPNIDGERKRVDYDRSEWTDIVAVRAGFESVLGLKADGTVLIAGDETFYGEHTADGWTNIKVPAVQ